MCTASLELCVAQKFGVRQIFKTWYNLLAPAAGCWGLLESSCVVPGIVHETNKSCLQVHNKKTSGAGASQAIKREGTIFWEKDHGTRRHQETSRSRGYFGPLFAPMRFLQFSPKKLLVGAPLAWSHQFPDIIMCQARYAWLSSSRCI